MTTSITSIAVTDANAKALRAVNKWGLHLADFAALTTSSSFSGFGNGTGYTVSDWISDGVFANLAAVQAVYPVCQSGADTVDWVLLQSACDFLSYNALGSTNRKNTARRLHIPAGLFYCNRSIQLGYARLGTPPANLNGNGYVSPALIGEGQQYDPSGNGMNGTTIQFTQTNDVGIAINQCVDAELRGLHIKGAYSYVYGNSAFLTNPAVWDIATFKDPALATANWIGGDAVYCGVAVDPYSYSAEAAAYPARILPSYFGGGTTSSGLGGSSDVLLEDVTISNFVVGFGRPNGDGNGEFLRYHRGAVVGCAMGFSFGHSQNRNVSIRDCNIAYFHTAISNMGGNRHNANMHGAYDNIHAGYGYQVFQHENGDWSGAVSIDGLYTEGIFRIGTMVSKNIAFNNGYFSMYDSDGIGLSPENHISGATVVAFRDCTIFSRNGLFIKAQRDGPTRIIQENTEVSTLGQANVSGDAAESFRYVNGIFGAVGPKERTVANTQQTNANGVNDAYEGRVHCAQDRIVYASSTPATFYGTWGADALLGGQKSFDVPYIGHPQKNIGMMSSRSGYDMVFSRLQIGSLKADVGDILYVGESGSENTLCIVTSISGGNMTLRQQNNYYSSSPTAYATSGYGQLTTGVTYYAHYICTRVRHNPGFIMGSVTSGSAVISSLKHAFNSGNSLDTATTYPYSWMTIAAGDLFIHQEVERYNVGGTPESPLNIVSAVDTTARTITLTNNFNVTDANYPVVFYVKVHNA